MIVKDTFQMRAPKNWKAILLFSLLATTLIQSEETCSAQDGTCSSASICQDNHPVSNKCPYWAHSGECEKNPKFMTVECRKSCGICTDTGVNQRRESDLHQVTSEQTARRLEEAQAYLQTVKPSLKELCKNQDEWCTVWAVVGECETNPNFMKSECPVACQSCEYLSIEGRCPIDPNAPSAWGPGDLNRMFERLSQEPFLSKHEVKVLSTDPWVITMENVVLPEEAERLIQLGGMEGYERSHEVGKVKADGSYEKETNTRRTSTNAWCQHECYEDVMAQKVVHRMSELTGIEEPNSEYLQLLRYSEGQAYTVHHDYIEHHLERQQGVRILTVYLYLNDVEAGGGTNFDQLNITVMPKRGRALLWPSVKNDDPNQEDHRTTHQALATEKGIKYGANAWFHMHDFKTPNRIGCST